MRCCNPREQTRAAYGRITVLRESLTEPQNCASAGEQPQLGARRARRRDSPWVWPMIFRPLVRSAYHWMFRHQAKLRCYYADRVQSTEVESAHIPPAKLRFRVAESYSAREFIRIGRSCAKMIAERIRESGVEMCPGTRILDFGCGCGRTITWLLRDYPDFEFHGVDVDSEAIEWCRTHLAGANFLVNRVLPPLPYSDCYFQIVYCLSVFTHLNEAMQDAWLSEQHRIIKPGGAIVLTIHGRNATRNLAQQDRATLEAVGFLHKTSKKMKGVMPEWYHTTWHSQTYVLNHLSRWFERISYFEVRDGVQDFVVAFPKH